MYIGDFLLPVLKALRRSIIMYVYNRKIGERIAIQ